MTVWRVITRTLHEAGGACTAQELEARGRFDFDVQSALDYASGHGLVRSEKGQGGSRTAGRWLLTKKGQDWCENRLTTVELRRIPWREKPPQFVGLRFVPTWLASLPRDIRIEQREPA